MAALQRLGTAGPEPGTAAGTAGAASAELGANGAKGAVLSVQELERPDFEQARGVARGEPEPTSLTAEMRERLHAWAPGSRSLLLRVSICTVMTL